MSALPPERTTRITAGCTDGDASDGRAGVIVVGAGPAGAAAAIVLARAGHHVTIVDRAAFPRDKPCGDLLGTLAIRTLTRIGVDLPVIRETPPLRGAYVYAPHGRRLGARINEPTARRLGARVIPRVRFDAALVACALASGATLVRAHVTGVIRDGDAIAGVTTATGSTLRAPLVIGADGWGSVVARAIVRAPRATRDAGVAVRTYIDGLAPSDVMRFFINRSGDGYGWIFPLADGGANVGLGFIRGEPGADDVHGAFARFLARPQFSGVTERAPRQAWPIPFGWRGTPVSAAGALLVGDAASLASSLSGSGIHTALTSGALAASIAQRALARGDVGALALADYDRALRSLARSLQRERRLHDALGTPARSSWAIDAARQLPGAGRYAVEWLLNLG